MKRNYFKLKSTVEFRLDVSPAYYDIQMIPYKVKPTQCVKPVLVQLAEYLSVAKNEKNN